MPQSKVTAGKIQFIQNTPPPLEAGEYEIETTQQITGAGIDSNNELLSRKRFFIRGERFVLKPSDVDSVFPPAMSEGHFEDTLPHLVFNNLTLPWERNIAGESDFVLRYEGEEIKTKMENGDRPPWLALMLFDEDDPAPTPKQIPIKNLLPGRMPKGIWFPPDFELEYEEEPDSSCTIIDVPKPLFLNIAPNVEEIILMAHGRMVYPDNKIKQKGNAPNGMYSALIGNRLPKTGKESIVHLVAMEGFGHALRNPDETLKGFHSVRMVSLKKWRFSCADGVSSFEEYFSNLDINEPGDIMFRYPLYKDVEEDAHSNIRELVDLGYIPMPHQMRQGYSNVAMYRGPLSPVKVEPFLNPPYDSQDELARFDPEKKLLDLSYSSAWQLGQLLALENKTFSQNLYNWKISSSHDEIKKAEQQLLVDSFDIMSDKDGKPAITLGELETRVGKVKPASLKSGSVQRNPNPFRRGVRKKVPIVNPYDFQEIEGFVDELRELNHVPFHYLVPNTKMLPEESLRLFNVDPNWIDALVDGALNPGNFAVKRRQETQPQEQNDDIPEVKPTLTGFILKSRVLEGWPGMEIFANPVEDDDGQIVDQAAWVRIERLAPDIVIGITSADLHTIIFREPAEGLHFGVEFDDEDAVKEMRRMPDDDKPGVPKVTVPFHNRNLGVLNLKQLSLDLDAKIDSAEMTDFGTFTTADFGYLMVEGVESAIVKKHVAPPPASA